jgi:hypothetical protein
MRLTTARPSEDGGQYPAGTGASAGVKLLETTVWGLFDRPSDQERYAPGAAPKPWELLCALRRTKAERLDSGKKRSAKREAPRRESGGGGEQLPFLKSTRLIFDPP